MIEFLLHWMMCGAVAFVILSALSFLWCLIRAPAKIYYEQLAKIAELEAEVARLKSAHRAAGREE